MGKIDHNFLESNLIEKQWVESESRKFVEKINLMLGFGKL